MKRKTTILSIIAILLALCVSSCRDASHPSLNRGDEKAVHAALLRAEALMESAPHAARAVLDSIAYPHPLHKGKGARSAGLPSFRRGKGEAALYALLRTQADYKNRTRLTSDTLIRVATDYYGTRRKSQHAALAQYYLGCTYADMRRDMDALDAFLRATLLFPDTTNKYFAYSHFCIAQLYLKHDKEADALSPALRYRWSNACTSDSVNIGFGDMLLGRIYLYLEQASKAEPFFLSVISNQHVSEDYRNNACFQLAKLYTFLEEDFDKASPFIEQSIVGYKQENKNGADFFLKGELFYHENQLDSALHYYNKVLTCEKEVRTFCETYKRLMDVSIALGRTDSVGVYLQRFVVLSDSVGKLRRDKEINEIENNHIIELHDRELAAHRSRLHWTWGILSALLLIATGAVLLLNDRRHKVKELKYEQQLKAIEKQYIQDNLKEEPEERRDPMDKPNIPPVTSDSQPDIPFFTFQQNRLALYRAQYEASKWNHYFILHGDDIHDEQFMSIGEAEAFLQYTSELFVNLTASLLRENPHINKDDVNFCCLTMLGFTTKQIAYCCRKPVKYCYNRRTRLSERLTPEWYQFIFGKQPKQA